MTSREQFDAWHRTQVATLVRCGAVERAREFEAMRPTLELAWDESRTLLAVHLPSVGPAPEPPEDAFDDSYLDAHHASIRMRNRCYLAIEAAGLKVAP